MTGQTGTDRVRLILASASPARLATLRSAGIDPLVEVSGVDESDVVDLDPAHLAQELATRKARAVVARLGVPSGPTLVLGCDSVLEFDGRAHGKPLDAAVARGRLRQLSGRSGVLHTGHHLVDAQSGQERAATASTRVDFAELTETEIDEYVATGEPLQVAGAFTLDGLGGAFVRGVLGDPHNVVGVSLPLVRELAAALGVAWPSLWTG